jgi:hypothetical protein
MTTEIHAPAMMDAAVVTFPRCEESRSATARHQPEWHGPTPEVVPPGVAPAAARKRASKCTSEDLSPRWEEEMGSVDLWVSPQS